MNIKNQIWGMCAASLVFCACSDNDKDDEKYPIRLSSRVEVVAASSARLQDLQIVSGQQLSFFVTRNTGENELIYDNVLLRADGNGGFAYSTAMYYPINGDNVNFYALHPYSGSASLDTPLDFSVQANQNIEENYLASDLLYSNMTDIQRTTSEVSLQFTHKLSKIDVQVVAGGGVDDLSGFTGLTVQNMLPSTTLDLSDGTLGTADGTAVDITPYGIETTSGTTLSGITAIVVPQTFTAETGKSLLAMNIDGVEFVYVPTADISFASGQKRTFIITVNTGGISVTSTVTDWTDGGTIEGDGGIE